MEKMKFVCSEIGALCLNPLEPQNGNDKVCHCQVCHCPEPVLQIRRSKGNNLGVPYLSGYKTGF